MLLRLPQLQIESAERRSAIAGDESRRVEPGGAIAHLLHQRQTHQRLHAGQINAAFGAGVFVLEGVVEVEFYGGDGHGGIPQQSDQARSLYQRPPRLRMMQLARAVERCHYAPARSGRGVTSAPMILFAGSGNGLQLADVRRVLRARARAAFAAARLDDEEGQSADRELHLLRGVESAVRHPALDIDGRRLVRGARTRQSRSGQRRGARGCCCRSSPTSACSATSSTAVPAREFQRADGVVRRRLPAAARSTSCCRSASRSIRSRRCRTRSTSTCAARAGAQLPRLRAVRDVLPASRRRSDHAADRARAAVRRSRAARRRRNCASGSR